MKAKIIIVMDNQGNVVTQGDYNNIFPQELALLSVNLKFLQQDIEQKIRDKCCSGEMKK